MTIKELDAITSICDGVYSCVFTVGDVPEEYIAEAKKADGEEYVEGCFIVHAYYDTADGSMSYNLVYLTNDGDDLIWSYKLSEENENKMLKCVREEILK